MADTKERILLTALRLFARDGYEAVSVSDIAGALGITKGALYRHYQNKRDIFNSILSRMERRDAEKAEENSVPAGTVSEMEDAYRAASIDSIIAFSKAMFRYWTQDEFASQFRRMLTVEQFRSAEMAKLYQQYLVSGPIGYVADLLGSLGFPQPERKAVALYAPMFLLYSVHDGGDNRDETLRRMDECLENTRKSLMADEGQCREGMEKHE